MTNVSHGKLCGVSSYLFFDSKKKKHTRDGQVHNAHPFEAIKKEKNKKKKSRTNFFF